MRRTYAGRRREYHRRKRQTDPLYRQVCLDSQEKWRARHPEYQKSYRLKHPKSVQCSREAQRRRDQLSRLSRLVKNNLALPQGSPSGGNKA